MSIFNHATCFAKNVQDFGKKDMGWGIPLVVHLEPRLKCLNIMLKCTCVKCKYLNHARARQRQHST